MSSELLGRLNRLENRVEELQSEVATLRARQRQLTLLAADLLKQSAPPGLDNVQKTIDLALTIVGGVAVFLGSFDECAAVGRRDAILGCSGVLVSPRIVVTAGHCGQRGNHPDPDVVALPLINSVKPTPAVEINGTFIVNPAFTENSSPNDIGVMVLEHVCAVTPVSLASTAEMIATAQATVVGFGNNKSRSGFGIKRSATVPIQFLAGGPCQTIPESVDPAEFDHNLEFIVGSEELGGCFGDSGGPVYIGSGAQRKVAGIISRPPKSQGRTCSGVTICTRIDPFAQFIADRTP